MTTTKYPPTPWDAEIAVLEAKALSPSTVNRLGLLRAQCLGYWEAKAENAPLLEAAREALEWFAGFGYNGFGIAMSDDNPDHEPIRRRLKTALAQAESKEAIPHDPQP